MYAIPLRENHGQDHGLAIDGSGLYNWQRGTTVKYSTRLIRTTKQENNMRLLQFLS